MIEHTVRRARRDEGPAIAELWMRSRCAAQVPPPVHDAAQVVSWVSGILLPAGGVWVVADRDELFAMMNLCGDELDQLYVSPEHRRRGHGARLLALAQAQRRTLELWTFVSNVGAQRFYEAHGFVRSGSISQDNEEHAPAIRYRWERGN